jgi:hypothetical protein
VVAAKIGYGTIKVNGWWYPVVGGEIRWNDSHQLNTTSLGIAGMFAQVAGLVVKSGYVHIEK